MQARIAGEQDRERFNNFVASSPLADVLQSWEWGEVKRSTGWDPIRLILEEGDELAGTCSMLLTNPARFIPAVSYAPRGPVLDYENEERLEVLIEAIRRSSREAFVFICDPGLTEGAADSSKLGGHMRRVASAGFGGVQPRNVMILDLTPELDKIMAGFKSKWRYNIRLAERKGVEITEGERDDVPAFHELLLETAARDGFTVRGLGYFETLWDQLAGPGLLKMLLARYQGRLVAGIILFCMGKRSVYTYGASSNEDRKVMPNHLIQWHAIRWAKENGYSIYDFRGVSPVRDGKPLNEDLAGLNRFKEGFGAVHLEYAGQFELPLRQGWYGLWRTTGPLAMRLTKRGASAAD